MDRNYQRIGLINWIVLLGAATVSIFVTRYVHSAAGMMATALLVLAKLVALISYFQMRLEERERLEKLEFDELTKTKGSSGLFTAEAESFPAQRSRLQFERFFVPVFTVILLLKLGSAIFYHWRIVEKNPQALLESRTLVAASIYGLLFLVLFLLGKFSAGLARWDGQRLLRASSGYLLLGGYISLIVATTIAVGVWAGVPKADLYVARALTVVLGLVAVEMFVGLLLELYRPRVRGKEARVLYESRLAGLLGQPEGIFKTAAHALDYQFGFKVSETWFYRFAQKAFAWIVLAQIAVLLLSTSFVFIETGEQALLERFGRPVEGRAVLEPGLHVKLPFPFERIYRYPTEQIQSFTIGLAKDDKHEQPKTILWSLSHEKEENMLVASHVGNALGSTNSTDKKSPPVNMLSVSIPVQYQITNLTSWAYNNEDPGELLQKLATREVVRYLVSADLLDIMSKGRGEAAETLRGDIQRVADLNQLGANIVFLGLQDIHPPVAVAPEYERVVAAMQAREANILQAKAFEIQTNALARAAAAGAVNRAEADREQLQVSALARAASFTNRIAAYEAAPGVYAQRVYLQTMASATKNARKYVITTTNTQDVITVNLEDKIRPDLSDIMVPSAKK
jgi:membrane protease subunit HflK